MTATPTHTARNDRTRTARPHPTQDQRYPLQTTELEWDGHIDSNTPTAQTALHREKTCISRGKAIVGKWALNKILFAGWQPGQESRRASLTKHRGDCCALGRNVWPYNPRMADTMKASRVKDANPSGMTTYHESRKTANGVPLTAKQCKTRKQPLRARCANVDLGWRYTGFYDKKKLLVCGILCQMQVDDKPISSPQTATLWAFLWAYPPIVYHIPP